MKKLIYLLSLVVILVLFNLSCYLILNQHQEQSSSSVINQSHTISNPLLSQSSLNINKTRTSATMIVSVNLIGFNNHA